MTCSLRASNTFVAVFQERFHESEGVMLHGALHVKIQVSKYGVAKNKCHTYREI